jgi:hypothetical protein
MKRAGRQSKMMNEHVCMHVVGIHLTPEQIAEIKRRLSDREPFATGKEVKSTFERLTKSRNVR